MKFLKNIFKKDDFIPSSEIDQNFELRSSKNYWYKALYTSVINHIYKETCFFKINTIHKYDRDKSEITLNLLGPELNVKSNESDLKFKIHSTAVMEIKTKKIINKINGKGNCFPDHLLIRTDKDTTKDFKFPMGFNIFKEINFWNEINSSNIKYGKTFPTTKPYHDPRGKGKYARVTYPRFVLEVNLDAELFNKFFNNLLLYNFFANNNYLDANIEINFKHNNLYQDTFHIDEQWNMLTKDEYYIYLEIESFNFKPVNNKFLTSPKIVGKLTN